MKRSHLWLPSLVLASLTLIAPSITHAQEIHSAACITPDKLGLGATIVMTLKEVGSSENINFISETPEFTNTDKPAELTAFASTQPASIEQTEGTKGLLTFARDPKSTDSIVTTLRLSSQVMSKLESMLEGAPALCLKKVSASGLLKNDAISELSITLLTSAGSIEFKL